MATPAGAFGLKPVRTLNGSCTNFQTETFYRGTGDANVICVGDVVKLGGSADANGIADVVQGTAGAACVGVVAGVGFNPSDLTKTYLPASTAGYLLVYTDPAIVYETLTDAQAVAADVGLNLNLILGTNSATSGSTFAVTMTGKATTATLDTKLLGFCQVTGGATEVAKTNARVLVKLNNHQYGTASAGV